MHARAVRVGSREPGTGGVSYLLRVYGYDVPFQHTAPILVGVIRPRLLATGRSVL